MLFCATVAVYRAMNMPLKIKDMTENKESTIFCQLYYAVVHNNVSAFF